MTSSSSTMPVRRHNCQFYAIGTKAENIEYVKFFQGFNLVSYQMKPRFSPLDLDGCGQIIVYLSQKEAGEILESLMKSDPSLNLEVIPL